MDKSKEQTGRPTPRPLPRTITVLLGGSSKEREVSLRTGVAVARALRSVGHTVLELDPQGADWSLPAATDVVFLALHGTYGEDGTVQERLEHLGVPYTGSGPEASRMAFDKVLTKERCRRQGLTTPRFLVIEQPGQPWPPGWEPPVVLKPVCQGSSVGLRFVEDRESWAAALEESFQHDARVLVEPKILGREITVGLLDHQALPIVEIRPRQGAYDYQNKYTAGATDYLCPAPLDEALTRRIQADALQAFQILGCRDYGRVDMMVAGDGTAYILEINTLPGMTETSLLPKAAAAAGLSYAELCQQMVDLALRRY
jgi:D-alanine-D-alanine ligase